MLLISLRSPWDSSGSSFLDLQISPVSLETRRVKSCLLFQRAVSLLKRRAAESDWFSREITSDHFNNSIFVMLEELSWVTHSFHSREAISNSTALLLSFPAISLFLSFFFGMICIRRFLQVSCLTHYFLGCFLLGKLSYSIPSTDAFLVHFHSFFFSWTQVIWICSLERSFLNPFL